MTIATACKNPEHLPEAPIRHQEVLVEALRNSACYEHDTGPIVLVETHISWVLLTGTYAYKIKKALKLPFLDFSTLERRRHFCQEELRLNHRSAPDLYLGVVDITGSSRTPRINGHGPVIEYAVKMLQFSQQHRLDYVLAQGGLERRHLDQLAHDVARLHRQAAVAGVHTRFASPACLRSDTLQNFDALKGFSDPELDPELLGRLRGWSETSLAHLETTFQNRRRQGFIRECHGDLHLENLVLHEERVQAFDCIEFNDGFRWIDVISEIAFLIMDLDYRGRPDLGRFFLNAYLEQSGDYAGLALLRHYLVYRAMVRVKVALIRLQQTDLSMDQRTREHADLIGYLRLAGSYIRDPAPAALIISHGLSGSGKSWLAAELAVHSGLIRIRSDVERKRCIESALYSEAATRHTYRRLAELAEQVIAAGYSVIVDATFLRCDQRREFQDLAERLGVPFSILQCRAAPEILERRIRERQGDVSDATVGVLAGQRRNLQSLGEREMQALVSVDTGEAVDVEAVLERIHLNPTS